MFLCVGTGQSEEVVRQQAGEYALRIQNKGGTARICRDGPAAAFDARPFFTTVGGDPAYVLAGKISSQEQIDNIRRQIGVDQPYYVQLGIFVKQIVTADFGASWSTNEKVSNILATRLGPSLTVV